MSRRIVFTGGGSAGHVIPNLTLIALLQADGWQVDYIGSGEMLEYDMVKARQIPYHQVSTGKLRRYFSWQNFIDPLKIFLGIYQSYFLLKKLQPLLVFSKGGFVAFPIVVAAWLHRIPIIAHESDFTPGLANRLSFPFINTLCLTFAEAKRHFKNQKKLCVTGTPIRAELFAGIKAKGLALCGFNETKPIVLIMGGSQGSALLNDTIRQALPKLCDSYQVIHLCGKGKIAKHLLNQADYCQFEYANEELAHLFAAADFVISRAGANTLCELLALKKPHLLIPLSAKVSRGDQLENARYFKRQGLSLVLEEEQLTADALLAAMAVLSQRCDDFILKMNAQGFESAAPKIIGLIKEHIHARCEEAV